MNFLFTAEMVLSYRVIIKRLGNHYSTFAGYVGDNECRFATEISQILSNLSLFFCLI